MQKTFAFFGFFRRSGAFDLARLLPAIVLLSALLPGLLINLPYYPETWLDEGFSLNAARTLAETGQYGTISVDGVRPFDPAISTGAPVIISLALVFHLLEPNLVTARAVIALFTTGGLFILYAAARYLYGSRDALLLALLVVAAPTLATHISFVALGRQVMGENVALALSLAALLLWWLSWSRSSTALALLAGGALGLALLAKLQIALTLLPTLLLIGMLRAWRNRTGLLRAWLPVGAALAVYATWIIISQLGTPAYLRAEHRTVLLDGLLANFWCDHQNRHLSNTAQAMLLLALAGAGGAIWRIVRRPPGQRLTAPAHWAEATLVTLVLLGSIGAGLFSIGWERYLYGIFIPGLLLLGKLTWDLLRWSAGRVGISERAASSLAAAALTILALLVHAGSALQSDPEIYNSAEQMAAYIAENVPPDAVIETWEWNLAALMPHTAFHYPHQLVMQRALRHIDLAYDTLQADPDYLLQGPFAAWTGIYRSDMLQVHFQHAVTFGPYALYRRIRTAITAS